jgi:hypothetical protein
MGGLKMKVYTKLPVYSGDVSGVASALYELGGMVVIHDPSGCNSTFNTHDEIRWFKQPSLIFISGLKESDALMGNDQKLIDDVVEAALFHHPKFIALINSPVPYLIGTDMQAICHSIEKQTKITTFYVSTNAMHDYAHGISLALVALAKKMTFDKGEKIPGSVNLLGVTPLDYTDEKSVMSMKETLAPLTVISTWCKDDSLENLKKSTQAEVNIVVSSGGLALAKYFEKTYGIPYVIGAVMKTLREDLFEKIEAVKTSGASSCLYEEMPVSDETIFIGEPVRMSSLGMVYYKKIHRPYKVLCDLEDHKSMLRKEDYVTNDEEEMADILKNANLVVGDPCYKRIYQGPFKAIPHLAMSGRLYLKDMMNLIDE